MGGSDHCYFLDAEATVDVLTANNDVNPCQNMNWMTAKSLHHFDRIYKLDNNNIITCIGKCYHLFAP